MTETLSDGVARRAYWAKQMESGYELVQQLLPFEVEECGEGLADIRAAAQASGVEMLFPKAKLLTISTASFTSEKGSLPLVGT